MADEKSIVRHIDGDASPRAVLENALETADRFRAIIVMGIDGDGEVFYANNKMFNHDFAWLTALQDYKQTIRFVEDDEEGATG